MATTKAVYINGQQLLPSVAYSVGAYGVVMEMIAIDWGKVARSRHYRARPLRDGDLRRGQRAQRRIVAMQLLSLVSDETPANRVEAVRDEWWSAMLGAMGKPTDGLVLLKQTREDTTGAAVARQIRGEFADTPAWVWSPDDVAEGLVGTHAGAVAVLPLTLECPFPWFEDVTATAPAGVLIDGTARNTTITNTGLVPAGLAFAITGSGAALTIVVTNTTTGAAAVIGNGITLTDVSATAGTVAVDWYSGNPLAYTVTEAGVAIPSKLSVGASIGLVPGANTIEFQVTAGTLTGGLIAFTHRNLWGNP